MRAQRSRRQSRSFARQIGARIRELRQTAGWSQRDLAARANLDMIQIGRYEEGSQKPPLGALIRIARAFGVLVDLLLPDVSEALDPVNARLLPRLRHLAGLGDAEKGIAIGLLDAVLAIDRLRSASRPQPAPEPDLLARR